MLVVAALSVAYAAPAAPRLVGPATAVEPSAGVTFTLTFAGAPVSVDGCTPVELDRREGDRWVAVAGAVLCDGTTPARAGASELTFTLASPGPGEYRGLVAWGTGCVAGRSFATAACRSRGIAESPAFTVVQR